MPERTVYILNKDANDYSPAEEFGSLAFVTEGPLDRFAVSNLYRLVHEAMRDSDAEDLIVIGGLPVLNMIAGAYFVELHGRLNLLIYGHRDKKYVERSLSFDNV